MKKIGDYLQPKPGAIINYSAWPKQYPHHNTISRYTPRVNIILANFRAKIQKSLNRDLGETHTEVTKGIIPFFDLLSEKTSAKKKEPTIKFSECTKDGFERFIL